jgi:hypothetical protein
MASVAEGLMCPFCGFAMFSWCLELTIHHLRVYLKMLCNINIVEHSFPSHVI